MRLTRRELEVAALVAAGLTNREIGERLFISERTVDGHLEHLREKLEMNSRAQIAAWYATRVPAPAASDLRPRTRTRSTTSARRLGLALSLLIALLAGGWLGYSRLMPPAGPLIVTVAGAGGSAGLGGYSGDNGPAIHAQLVGPEGVAIGPAGDLYINDGSTLRVVNRQGVIVTVAGGGRERLSEGASGPSVAIDNINGIAVGREGDLYLSITGPVPGVVSTSGTHQVLHLAPDLRLRLLAGLGTRGHTGGRLGRRGCAAERPGWTGKGARRDAVRRRLRQQPCPEGGAGRDDHDLCRQRSRGFFR